MSKTFATYGRLLGYARPYRGRLILGLLAGAVSGGSLFGVITYLPRILNVFEHPEQLDVQQLGVLAPLAERLQLQRHLPQGDSTAFLVMAIAGLVGFFALKALMAYANKYLMRWVGSRVIMDLRSALFHTLQHQSLAFHGRTDVGGLISRCVNDTTYVEVAVSDALADVTRAPVEILALMTSVVVLSIAEGIYILPIAMFFIMPLCLFPIIALGRKVKAYFHRALERISDLVSRMHETFTGIRVIKAYHTEAAEEQRFREINQRYFKQVLRGLRAELLMTPIMECAGVALVCVLLIYCHLHGIGLSQILPMAGAAVMAYEPIKRLAKVSATLQRSIASAERIFQLLDTHTELPEPTDPVPLPAFRDAVRFDRVAFSYGADQAWQLRDLNIEVPRGKVVAIVGATGSGKSTLANLLARFYDVTGGSITIDGVDVRQIATNDLRRIIGVVTQEVIIFNDTLANNIAYGSPNATPEQIADAARKAHAYEFIVAEPEGFQRVVGEKGFILSGGQRQRIAIARAILRNPEILILDEATSALDTVTEQLIQDALTTLMRDRTVFAIAHRLSTIRHAHRIYVMDDGRIVESGTHDELLAKGGRYAQLCAMQQA